MSVSTAAVALAGAIRLDNEVPLDQIPALVFPALGDTLIMVGIVMAIVVAVGIPLGALVHNLGPDGLFENRALHTVLSKHRAKGLGELSDDIAGMIKHVKRFEEALASPSEARFVVVTRGEELAAARTERLVDEILSLPISAGHTTAEIDTVVAAIREFYRAG